MGLFAIADAVGKVDTGQGSSPPWRACRDSSTSSVMIGERSVPSEPPPLKDLLDACSTPCVAVRICEGARELEGRLQDLDED